MLTKTLRFLTPTFLTSGSLRLRSRSTRVPSLHGLQYSLEAATNQTLGVEDRVFWVHGRLIFGGIANQALLGGESDIRRGRPVTLLFQCQGYVVWRLFRHSRSLAMISTRSFCHTPTQLWGIIIDGLQKRIWVMNLRIGSAEIDTNCAVVHVLHF